MHLGKLTAIITVLALTGPALAAEPAAPAKPPAPAEKSAPAKPAPQPKQTIAYTRVLNRGAAMRLLTTGQGSAAVQADRANLELIAAHVRDEAKQKGGPTARVLLGRLVVTQKGKLKALKDPNAFLNKHRSIRMGDVADLTPAAVSAELKTVADKMRGKRGPEFINVSE